MIRFQRILPEQLLTSHSNFQRELGKLLLKEKDFFIYYCILSSKVETIQFLFRRIYTRLTWNSERSELSAYITGDYIAEDPFTGTRCFGGFYEIDLENLKTEISRVINRAKEIFREEIEMEKIKIKLKPL